MRNIYPYEINLNHLKGKKVLVCEDSPDNQFLAKKFLAKINADIDFVENGKEALVLCYAMRTDRDKCFDAGCNEFLAKPYNSDSLLKTMAKCI